MTHTIDPVDVLHSELLSIKDGFARAAKHIGRSRGTLHNKFSESVPGNVLSGWEERAIADFLRSEKYIQAVCAHFGGVFLRLPEGMAGDDDLFEDYLGIIKEMGDLSKEFIAAKEDGDVDVNEFERLRREAYEVVAAIQRFITDMQTRVVEKPAAVPLRRSGGR